MSIILPDYVEQLTRKRNILPPGDVLKAILTELLDLTTLFDLEINQSNISYIIEMPYPVTGSSYFYKEGVPWGALLYIYSCGKSKLPNLVASLTCVSCFLRYKADGVNYQPKKGNSVPYRFKNTSIDSLETLHWEDLKERQKGWYDDDAGRFLTMNLNSLLAWARVTDFMHGFKENVRAGIEQRLNCNFYMTHPPLSRREFPHSIVALYHDHSIHTLYDVIINELLFWLYEQQLRPIFPIDPNQKELYEKIAWDGIADFIRKESFQNIGYLVWPPPPDHQKNNACERVSSLLNPHQRQRLEQMSLSEFVNHLSQEDNVPLNQSRQLLEHMDLWNFKPHIPTHPKAMRLREIGLGKSQQTTATHPRRAELSTWIRENRVPPQYFYSLVERLALDAQIRRQNCAQIKTAVSSIIVPPSFLMNLPEMPSTSCVVPPIPPSQAVNRSSSAGPENLRRPRKRCQIS